MAATKRGGPWAPLPVNRWCQLVGVVLEPEFVALRLDLVGLGRDAAYAGGPFHPVSHVLGLVGAEQLVGEEPGDPLARGEAGFDEPPGTGQPSRPRSVRRLRWPGSR